MFRGAHNNIMNSNCMINKDSWTALWQLVHSVFKKHNPPEEAQLILIAFNILILNEFNSMEAFN